MTTRFLSNTTPSDTLVWQSSIPVSSLADGSANQTLRQVGSNPTWTNVSTRFAWYPIPFTTLQNWNAGATTTLTFGGLGGDTRTTGTPAYVPLSTTGVAPFTTFTQNNDPLGFNEYRFDFTVALDNPALPLSPAQVGIKLVVNGVPDSVPITYNTLGGGLKSVLTGSTTRLLLNGSTVGFQAQRISGTDTLLCNGGTVLVTLLDTCL